MYHDSKKIFLWILFHYFQFKTERILNIFHFWGSYRFPLDPKAPSKVYGLANRESFVQGKVSYKFGFTLLQITSVVYCRWNAKPWTTTLGKYYLRPTYLVVSTWEGPKSRLGTYFSFYRTVLQSDDRNSNLRLIFQPIKFETLLLTLQSCAVLGWKMSRQLNFPFLNHTIIRWCNRKIADVLA